MSVAGLTCVVTGAASGIGREITARLVGGGATVTALDRVPADGVRTVEVDLGDPRSIDEAVTQLDGPVDALLNVAGVPGTQPAETVMRVNVLGLRHLTEAMLEHLRPGGSIVNVASIAGFGWPHRLELVNQLLATESVEDGVRWFAENAPAGNAYNFSKEAVIVYTLASGLRLGPRDLGMNAVLPGAVETPILVDFEESMGKDLLDGVRSLLGRHATPADIAPAAVFLASRDSAWIRASTLTADGGLMGAVGAGLVPAPAI